MRKIVYYVALSLDGFISGHNEDISLFVGEGNGLDQYLQDLKGFDTVIMGRRTYEFGYDYGLIPGMPAYPHMEHYIFSSTLQLDNMHPKVHVVPVDTKEVETIKETPGSDIYLCGGGQFAGWLLDNNLIDILKIKLNPILLGNGVRLFGDSGKAMRLKLLSREVYDHGLQIISYSIH